jgi:Leucine-rich repeat (LRR) protein
VTAVEGICSHAADNQNFQYGFFSSQLQILSTPARYTRQMKLTPALISTLFETPMADLTSLDMSNKEVSHIDDISGCISLRKLNLAKNAIRSSDALSGLQYLPDLTWLNLSNNSLENFEGLQKLKSLFGKCTILEKGVIMNSI